ncbi:hypothetical protein D9M72_579670 [compost metagenome]
MRKSTPGLFDGTAGNIRTIVPDGQLATNPALIADNYRVADGRRRRRNAVNVYDVSFCHVLFLILGLAPCIVELFQIEVTEISPNFKERGQRVLDWLSPSEAARRVREIELKSLLISFKPDLRKRQG